MKIYVACHCQDTARDAAEVLSTAGHEITSRWLQADFKPTDQHREPDRPVIAQEDFDDVAAADALVLVAGPDRYSGGKFVETGIALGMGKRVVVIGRRENMLIWLPAIQQVDDPQSAADLLSQSDFDARIRSALVEDEPKQNYNCPCIHPSQCDGSCTPSEIERRAEELEAMADVIMDSGKAAQLEAKVAMERAAKLLRSLAVATPPAVPAVERKAEPVDECDHKGPLHFFSWGPCCKKCGEPYPFTAEPASTPPAAAVSVPDGWQLVPKEPTEEMLDAYWHQTGESKEMRSRTHAYMRRYYSAMLSASPSPVDSRDEREFLHSLIENAFSWALQDCNYLNPKYMDRLIDCTHDGMNPEQAAIWNATAPEQAARAALSAAPEPVTVGGGIDHFDALRIAYERGAIWRETNGSLELMHKASYDYADKATSPEPEQPAPYCKFPLCPGNIGAACDKRCDPAPSLPEHAEDRSNA